MKRQPPSLFPSKPVAGSELSVSSRGVVCGVRAFLFTLCLLSSAFSVNSACAEDFVVEEIADNVFVRYGVHETISQKNRGGIANIGFIVGKRCVAVIDTGSNPEEGARLKRAVREITNVPVCYVINSHVHPDHIFGNLAFKQDGVRFYGHKKLPRAMALRGAHYLKSSSAELGTPLPDEAIVFPDRVVEKEVEIDLGGRVLTLIAYPTAHTDSDLSVFDETSGVIWLSDILFTEHVPVLDGSVNGWLGLIEQLESKKVSLAVPGHGRAGRNLVEMLRPQKRYLEKLRDEIRSCLKRGCELEAAIETVGKSERNNWKLFDRFHKRSVAAAYSELEWEE